jgi:hypothetical protein
MESKMNRPALVTVPILAALVAFGFVQAQVATLTGTFRHLDGTVVTKGNVFMMNPMGYERFLRCREKANADINDCARKSATWTARVIGGDFSFQVFMSGNYWLVGVCTDSAQGNALWVSALVHLDGRDKREDLRLQDAN